MKKIFLQFIILAGIFSALETHAQRGFHVGGQWGPHLSWLRNQDDVKNPAFDYQTTWRGAFAVNAQYGFSKYSGIGLSVLYSFQGQHYNLAGKPLFKRVEYIKVPLVFVYNYMTTDKLWMIYKIGPQLDFLTHARMTDNKHNDLVPNQMNAYMSTKLGGMASVGVGFEVAPRLFLDLTLRGDYGFTNAEDNNHNMHVNDPVITSNDNEHTNDRAATHTATLGLNLGIRYILCRCNRNTDSKKGK